MKSTPSCEPRRPLRVLHLAQELGLGGAARQLHNLLLSLPRGEHAVCYLGGGDQYVEPLRAAGIPVRCLELGHRRDAPRVVAELYTELCRGEYQLLTTQVWLAHSIGRLAAAACQVPVVSILTSASYDPIALSTFGPLGRLKSRLVQGTDIVTGALWTREAIAVSRFVGDYATRDLLLPRARVTVIPNSVDLLTFRPPDIPEKKAHRAALGAAPDERLLLTLVRPNNPKGADRLIDAMPWVLSRQPQARLLLLGLPPGASALLQRAERAGVGHAVRALGQHLNVWPYLSAADVFVSASPIEGLPVAVLEAMACALPCVLSDIPAHREVSGRGEAALLSRAESAPLAEALVALCQDPDRAQALGQRAHRRCLEHYTSHEVAAQVDAVFQRAAAPSRWQRRERNAGTRLLALCGRALEGAAHAAGLANLEIGL